MTPCSRFFFIDSHSHCTLVAWSSSCHPARLCFLSLQMPFQPWAQVPVEVLHAHRDVFTAGESLAPSSSAAAWSSRTLPTTSMSCTPKLLYVTPPSLDHDHGYGPHLVILGLCFLLSLLSTPIKVALGGVSRCLLPPACSLTSI